MTHRFEVGASMRLRAMHRLPWSTEAEREPHEHDYRIEVVVDSAELDARGVVCDLDALRDALERVLGRLDGSDLDEIRPDDAEGVTAELLARWLHAELREPVRLAGGQYLTIRVWPAPDVFGGFRAPIL